MTTKIHQQDCVVPPHAFTIKSTKNVEERYKQNKSLNILRPRSESADIGSYSFGLHRNYIKSKTATVFIFWKENGLGFGFVGENTPTKVNCETIFSFCCLQHKISMNVSAFMNAFATSWKRSVLNAFVISIWRVYLLWCRLARLINQRKIST